MKFNFSLIHPNLKALTFIAVITCLLNVRSTIASDQDNCSVKLLNHLTNPYIEIDETIRVGFYEYYNGMAFQIEPELSSLESRIEILNSIGTRIDFTYEYSGSPLVGYSLKIDPVGELESNSFYEVVLKQGIISVDETLIDLDCDGEPGGDFKVLVYTELEPNYHLAFGSFVEQLARVEAEKNTLKHFDPWEMVKESTHVWMSTSSGLIDYIATNPNIFVDGDLQELTLVDEISVNGDLFFINEIGSSGVQVITDPAGNLIDDFEVLFKSHFYSLYKDQQTSVEYLTDLRESLNKVYALDVVNGLLVVIRDAGFAYLTSPPATAHFEVAAEIVSGLALNTPELYTDYFLAHKFSLLDSDIEKIIQIQQSTVPVLSYDDVVVKYYGSHVHIREVENLTQLIDETWDENGNLSNQVRSLFESAMISSLSQNIEIESVSVTLELLLETANIHSKLLEESSPFSTYESNQMSDYELIQSWLVDRVEVAANLAIIDILNTPKISTPTVLNNSQFESLSPNLVFSDFESLGNQTQKGFQLEVYDSSNDLIYNTGFVQSVSDKTHTYAPGEYNGYNGTSNDVMISEPLSYGSTYTWRVRYIDTGDGWSDWSEPGEFTIANEEDVFDIEIVSPNQPLYNVGQTMNITWISRLEAGTEYKIHLLKNGSLHTYISHGTTSTSYQWEIPENQELGGDYKVLIINADNENIRSESGSFEIGEIADPIDVAILEFSADESFYAPNQSIGFEWRIWNNSDEVVGASEITYYLRRQSDGQIVASENDVINSLNPKQSRLISESVTGQSLEGFYILELVLTNPSDNKAGNNFLTHVVYVGDSNPFTTYEEADIDFDIRTNFSYEGYNLYVDVADVSTVKVRVDDGSYMYLERGEIQFYDASQMGLVYQAKFDNTVYFGIYTPTDGLVYDEPFLNLEAGKKTIVPYQIDDDDTKHSVDLFGEAMDDGTLQIVSDWSISNDESSNTGGNLVVNLPSMAPRGNYTFWVEIDNNFIHRFEAEVIDPIPTFEPMLSQSKFTTAPGRISQMSISAHPVDGFNETILCSGINVPVGVSIAFDQNGLFAVGETIDMTISVSESFTDFGIKNLTLLMTSDTKSHQLPITLDIVDPSQNFLSINTVEYIDSDTKKDSLQINFTADFSLAATSITSDWQYFDGIKWLDIPSGQIFENTVYESGEHSILWEIPTNLTFPHAQFRMKNKNGQEIFNRTRAIIPNPGPSDDYCGIAVAGDMLYMIDADDYFYAQSDEVQTYFRIKSFDLTNSVSYVDFDRIEPPFTSGANSVDEDELQLFISGGYYFVYYTEENKLWTSALGNDAGGSFGSFRTNGKVLSADAIIEINGNVYTITEDSGNDRFDLRLLNTYGNEGNIAYSYGYGLNTNVNRAIFDGTYVYLFDDNDVDKYLLDGTYETSYTISFSSAEDNFAVYENEMLATNTGEQLYFYSLYDPYSFYSESQTFDINSTYAPEFIGLEELELTEDQDYDTLQLADLFADQDTDLSNLEFEFLTISAGIQLVYDTINARFAIRPIQNIDNDQSFKIEVSDGYNSINHGFEVSVAPVDDNGIAVIEGKTIVINEDDSVKIPLDSVFVDIDSELADLDVMASISLAGDPEQPGDIDILVNEVYRYLLIKPAANESGEFLVNISIVNVETDSLLNFGFNLDVSPINDPPENFSLISPLNDRLVAGQVDFEWEASSDREDDEITYEIIISIDETEIAEVISESQYSYSFGEEFVGFSGYWQVVSSDGIDETYPSNNYGIFQIVGDSSDLYPFEQIVKSDLSFSVDEDIEVGTVFGNVLNYFPSDLTLLKFALEEADLVEINSEGYLSLTSELDFETQSEYNIPLVIVYNDLETISYSSEIVISVQDVEEIALINSFSFPDLSAIGVIDAENHFVSVEVPYGTELTSLIPEISVSEGGTVSPQTGVSNDFSDVAIYTITNSDGQSSQEWQVDVSYLPNTESDILAYSISEQVEEPRIDYDYHTIEVMVRNSVNVSALVASFDLSYGASMSFEGVIQVSSETENDFSPSRTFVVTAEDGLSATNWTVVVFQVPNWEVDILGFSLLNQIGSAVMDRENFTVEAIVDYSEDITALTPTIEVSQGATISPTSGIAQDFTNPVTYTVTAEDGETTQDWVVTVVRSDGLLAHYPLDGSGVDISGRNHHLSEYDLYEQPAYIFTSVDLRGEDPGAYDIKNNGDHLKIDVSDGAWDGTDESFTFNAWVKLNALTNGPNWADLVFESYTQGDNIQMLIDQYGKLVFHWYDGTTWPSFYSGFGLIQEDLWEMLTVTIDSENNVKLFHNGQEIDQYLAWDAVNQMDVEFDPSELSIHKSGVDNFRIGAPSYSLPQGEIDRNLDGLVHEVRIYERALTEEEIENLFNEEIALSVEAEIIEFGFATEALSVSIDPFNHEVDVLMPGGADLSGLVADFTISTGAIAEIGGIVQTPGATVNDFTQPVAYRVFAGNGSDYVDWQINVQMIDDDDVNSLLALYNATEGENWNQKWDLSESPDTWYGVTWTDGSVTDINLIWNNLNGYIPSEIGNLANLETLHLDGNGLSGEIPEDFQELQKLRELSLANTGYEGHVTVILSFLSNLEYLDLRYISLSGNTFWNLSHLSSLKTLYLDGTSLSGTIHPDLGNLSNLEILSLENNDLTGDIPVEIGNLTNLKTLKMGYNSLSGTIPTEIGGLSDLSVLTLSGNSLSGEIPSSIGNLLNLQVLELADNSLSGSIPAEIGDLGSLTHLRLNHNNLSGPIPNEIGNLSNLYILMLHSNRLSGALPAGIGNLASLDYLAVYDNLLEGAIPEEMATMSSLTRAYLSGNAFSSLPDFSSAVWQSNITVFDVSDNSLTFSDLLPNRGLTGFYYHTQDPIDAVENIGNALGQSHELSVSENAQGVQYQWYKDEELLDGETSSVLTISSATVDDLGSYHCEMTHVDLPALVLLRNPINLLDGALSSETEILSFSAGNQVGVESIGDGQIHLEVLYGTNLFNLVPDIEISEGGSISPGLNEPQDFTVPVIYTVTAQNGTSTQGWQVTIDYQSDGFALVDLYNSTNGPNWHFTWDLGQPIDAWHGIEVENGRVIRISLNQNNLTGTIPSSIGSLSELKGLYFYNNQLEGNIPVEIGNLQELEGLVLGSNSLSGSIPNEIGNLTNLKELILNVNALVGEIPIELFNLTELSILYLGLNSLSGTIPTQIGNLVNLSALELSYNNLEGALPSEIGDLIQTDRLFLSNNALSGTIPDEIGNLSNLLYLELGDNKLSGEIPESLGDLGNLERLYLENNQLSGSIPDELSEIANLNILDLSGNSLSGQIPESIGGLAALNDLNLSFNNLTGEIPTEFSTLSSLKFLNLSDNELSGEIPDEVGVISSLITLQLNQNQFTGSLPASLGDLTNLYYLNLSSNLLEGEIPVELAGLQALGHIDLSQNGLTGFVPYELASNPNYWYIYLNDNLFTGLPNFSESSWLGAIQDFDLRNNLLGFSDMISNIGINGFKYGPQGRIDTIDELEVVLGETVELTTNETTEGTSYQWYLNDVAIEGATSVSYMMESLQEDDLGTYYCLLTNSNVPVLELRRNNIYLSATPLSNETEILSFSLDEQIAQAIINTQEHTVNITVESEANITSLIPVIGLSDGASVSPLSGVPQDFTNPVTYTITAEDEVTTQEWIVTVILEPVENKAPTIEEEEFTLAENSIVGTQVGFITASDPDGDDLTFSIISGNDLGAFHVDENTGELSVVNSQALDYEVTPVFGISVQVTDGELSNHATIIILLLDEDEVEFDLETDSLALVKLYQETNGHIWLDHSGWLESNLSEWFGVDIFNDRVRSVLLRDNNLNGPIPIEIGNLTGLEFLNLASNNLTGEIPSSIGNLASIRYLSISGNIETGGKITGSIPDEVGNLKTIEILDLSFNEIGGNIPPSFAGLTSIQVLRLEHNNLIGVLPQELGLLSNLESIFASHNNLEGEIPTSIGNLSKLMTFAVDNNQFEGDTPMEFQNLTALQNLYLHDNKITSIPNLSFLEHFDTSVGGGLIIYNNKIGFSSLVSNRELLISHPYKFHNQIIDDSTMMIVDKDSSIVLTTSESSEQTSYSWYHNGNEIAGANDRELSFLFDVEDEGIYTCNMMHPEFPDFILKRNPIIISSGGNAPTINDQEFSIDENPGDGAVVGIVDAWDADGDVILFSILSGNELGGFEINESTGELTVAGSEVLDFESLPTFVLSVEVSDGELSDDAIITINLIDVDEPVNSAPMVTNAQFSIEEHSVVGTIVGQVDASDIDGNDLTYSIESGNDLGAFEIRESGGEISVANSEVLEFDDHPVFELVIEVSDGELSTKATVTINLIEVIIDGVNELSSFSLYPNPTSEFFHVDWPQFERMELYDLSGTLVKSSRTTRLDVHEIKEAVYILKVLGTNGQVRFERIIKK